jgi:hypothetical protein
VTTRLRTERRAFCRSGDKRESNHQASGYVCRPHSLNCTAGSVPPSTGASYVR